MALISVFASLCLLGVVLLDAFETMVLPRRVTRRFRLTRLIYRTLWFPWREIALSLKPGKLRENFLSMFGPLSILLLCVCWMIGLTLGFAWLHLSLGTVLNSHGEHGFGQYMYMSGTTIFTLGFGDVVPLDPLGRFLSVVEAGTGFGFLAVVIGYLPVLYQSFSRRETMISMLDARAGSPPSGGEWLLRAAHSRDVGVLLAFMHDMEQWSAEVLESHLSYPVLSYYRSQHDNQSWLAAICATLDACALMIANVKEGNQYQALLTFAMARHVVVDLALVFHVPPQQADHERLPDDALAHLRAELRTAEVSLHEDSASDDKLAELRAMYEPFVIALGQHFLVTVPEIFTPAGKVDNWQTSAWMRRTVGIGKLPVAAENDEHFV